MPIGGPVNIHGIDTVFPPLQFPTVFADGVLNLAPGNQTVKFYFQRLMPSFAGANDFQAQPFLQVAMPLQAFIQTSIFFERSIQDMITQKLISAEYVGEIRKELETALNAASANS